MALQNAFKTPLHVYSPTSPKSRWAYIPHVRHDSLDTFLPELDILSLHCPLTDATRNLIGEEQLASMKSSAYLINVARGGVVDEHALELALRNDRLAGAAIGACLSFIARRRLGLTLTSALVARRLGGRTAD